MIFHNHVLVDNVHETMYAHAGLNQMVAANIANVQKVNVKIQKQQKIYD